MGADPRTVALAGLGSFGQKCLTAIAACERLTLVGVADRDGQRAKEAGGAYNAPHFTDQRQLLTQTRPELVIAAAPPPVSLELARQGSEMGVHVAKAAPLARTLDEAADLLRAFGRGDVRLAVLSPRWFNDSYRALWRRREQLGPIFLGRAQYVLNWGGRFGWRADQATAGGGVLLEAGYDMLDLLLRAMGLPEEVYGVTGRRGRPHMIAEDGEQVKNLGIYDTDDTAAVVLRYASGAAGMLTATWVSSPAAEGILLHGQRGSAQADPAECILRDLDGQVLERVAGDDRPVSALTEQLTALAEGLDAPAPRSLDALRQHLLTQATVEAAYLSDRTGAAESPRRLLRARDLDPADWPGAAEMTGLEPAPAPDLTDRQD